MSLFILAKSSFEYIGGVMMATETLDNILIKKEQARNNNRFSPSPLDIEERCEEKEKGQWGNYKKYWDKERKHYVWVKIYTG